jgi:hypothetical protein
LQDVINDEGDIVVPVDPRIETAGGRASGGLKGLGRQAELLRTECRADLGIEIRGGRRGIRRSAA